MRLNTMVRDLDLLPTALIDNRRLEDVADGLLLLNGTRLAIDTTIVSALKRDRGVRRGCEHTSGVAIISIYPELSGVGGHATLSGVGDGSGEQMVSGDASVSGCIGTSEVT